MWNNNSNNNNNDNPPDARANYAGRQQQEYQPIFQNNQNENQMPLGYGNTQQPPQQYIPQGEPQQSSQYYSPYQSTQQMNQPVQQSQQYGQMPDPVQFQYGYQSQSSNGYYGGQYGYQQPYQDAGYNMPPQGSQYQGNGYNIPPQDCQSQNGQQYGYVDSGYSDGYSQNSQWNGQNQYAGQEYAPQKGQGAPLGGYQESGWKLPISENALILLLGLVVLPVLFVLSVTVPGLSSLGWIYIALAVIGMVLLWLFSSSNPNQKLTLTVVHAVLCIITLVTLLTSAPRDTTNASGGQPQSLAENAGYVNPQSDSNPMAFVPEETPTPTEDISQTSATADALNSFMYLWSTNNQTAMLTYCSPSWTKSQERPEVSLFSIIANRLPTGYAIEKISGTEADSSRTATITAAIVRQGSTAAEEKYRYQIIMTNENGNWYVDPSSLKSNEKTETATPEAYATATLDSSVTPDPNTILYYNPDGGKLYHIDPNCESVDKKYRPLTGSFKYSEIYDSKYSTLTKCAKCKAPKRIPKN